MALALVTITSYAGKAKQQRTGNNEQRRRGNDKEGCNAERRQRRTNKFNVGIVPAGCPQHGINERTRSE